ncbi:SGNH/GDSL hydrolase family protein [Ancylobacter lacus]|uniref:SGNH/GDSL hydrolase family protein n=1 Tax=Ancylobacter lacus TaxID=2579970 RepID=UPI001BCD2849|nr:SGNH/GDSL hydrolase family protein [Ancylobacter lacus]MBS7539396.1 SGNH/GDSL hydrolase family protein [Ancylobacter lacus]
MATIDIVSPGESDSALSAAITALHVGGWKTVADLAVRNALPDRRRAVGMVVFVASEGIAYQLVDGTDNTSWRQLLAAPVSGVSGDTVVVDGLTTDTTPTLTGSAPPGAPVEVVVVSSGGTATTLTTTANSAGVWTATLSTPVGNSYKVHARVLPVAYSFAVVSGWKAVATIADANHSGLYTTTGSDISATYRRPHYMTVAHGGRMRLRYFNGYLDTTTPSEVAGPNAIAVKASIEYPAGTFTPVTWSGAGSVTLTGGQVLDSDDIMIAIPPGTQFWTRTYVSVAGVGMKWPLGYAVGSTASTNILGMSGGGRTLSSDLTTSGTIANLSTTSYGPSAVFGNPAVGTRSVAFVGDSIATGQGDQDISAGNDGGFIVRAINNRYGWVRVSRPGERLQQAALNFTMRGQIISQAATLFICQHGVNDPGAGRTTAQMQADYITLWGLVSSQGIPVWQTTLTPRPAAAADGWMTLAGQTLSSSEGVRSGVNVWLRDGAPIIAGAAAPVGSTTAIRAGETGHPLAKVVDSAAAVEDLATGKWKPPFDLRTVTDAVTAIGSTTLTSATAAFAAGDQWKRIWVSGAMSSPVQISAVVNATTVTLSSAATATLSGATALFGTRNTDDGVHPTTPGHKAMADRLVAAGL